MKTFRSADVVLEDIEKAYRLFENKLDGVIKAAVKFLNKIS